MRNILGDDPWDIQARIIESVRDNRRTSVRSCHSMGKSWIAARAALHFAACYVPSIVITTAPTFRQVQKIIWQEMRKAYHGAKRPLGGDMKLTEWTIADKWFAFGFSTDDATAFQGLHQDHVLLIMDEAAGVSPNIWEASDSVLSSGHTRFLSIGNPTEPSGPFFDEHRLPGVNKIRVSAFDTPNFTEFGITLKDIATGKWEDKIGGRKLPRPSLISPEWVSERHIRWGANSPMFLSRVLAEFPQHSTDALIPLGLIEAAVNRTIERGKPHQLGCDVARFGDDSTVINERWGQVVRIIHKLEKFSTMETVGYIAKRQIESEPGVLAKVDPIGVGSGVVDRLKELEHLVAEVNVARAAKDTERFPNARSEWYWDLRERFEKGEIDIEDNENLIAQLSSIKYDIDSRGRIVVESKKKMMEPPRNLPSPDEADALMIVMSGVTPTTDGYKGASNKKKATHSKSVFGGSAGSVKRKAGGLL